MTVEDIMDEVLKYKTYYNASGGGVTVSGGEPFMQAEFLTETLKSCKQHGIHTAIDTSGYTTLDNAKKALQYTDLLLLDIKTYNPETYKKVTGVDIDRTLDVLHLSQALNIPTWVRYVLVPGLTDNMDEIKNLAEFLKSYSNVEKVDVLPFHKEGEYKWKSRNIPYELTDTPPPTPEMVEEAARIFKK